MNIYLQNAKKAKAAMEALHKKAAAENRIFTAEEEQEFTDQQKIFDDNIAMHEKTKAIDKNNNLFVQPVDDDTTGEGDGGDGTGAGVSDVQVTGDEPKWQHKGDFFKAVAAYAVTGHMDNRLQDSYVKMPVDAAAGSNTAVPSEGGFIVESEVSKTLDKKTWDTSIIAQRCRKQPIGAGKNSLTRNVVKEDSRATGSRYGGIQVYWIPEAGTITAKTPEMEQQETKLNKVAGLCYVTEEQLQDGVALLGSIMEDYPEEIAFEIDDKILSGTGAGMPLGIYTSKAKIEVAKRAGQEAASIVWENIQDMWRRMWAPARADAVWYINQDCETELNTMAMVVGTGGVPVYLPPGGASADPYARLMGRPVIPIEQCETVGTAGDILLGNFAHYQLIDKAGEDVRVDESIHVQFLTDQRAYRFIKRIGGQPRWKKPITPYKGTETKACFITLATRS